MYMYRWGCSSEQPYQGRGSRCSLLVPLMQKNPYHLFEKRDARTSQTPPYIYIERERGREGERERGSTGAARAASSQCTSRLIIQADLDTGLTPEAQIWTDLDRRL